MWTEKKMYEFPTKSNGNTSRQNKRVGFTASFAKLHEFSVEFPTAAGKIISKA